MGAGLVLVVVTLLVVGRALVGAIEPLASVVLTALGALLATLRALVIVVATLLAVLVLVTSGGCAGPEAGPPTSSAVG